MGKMYNWVVTDIPASLKNKQFIFDLILGIGKLSIGAYN